MTPGEVEEPMVPGEVPMAAPVPGAAPGALWAKICVDGAASSAAAA
jgi:hypothetical protein